jgi:oligopeptide transport system substrate-binding protein
VSEDGLRYTARLRRDAVWSDGEPVKAGDFAFAWQEIRERGLETAHLLDDVAETSEIDQATLEIRLNKPSPYFVYLLALPYLFPWPRHVCEQVGDAWLQPPHSVSNGAFVLAEQAEGHELLVANERWHGDRRGNVAEILVRSVPPYDYPTASQGGDIDIQFEGRGADPRDLERGPGLGTQFVGFVVDAPPFDDVLVRRAFAHALDRTLIARMQEGAGEPASHGGFVPAAMPGHSHRIGLDYDVAHARELLTSAGFPSGRGLPVIRLAVPNERWAEAVASQWHEHLGAEVTIVLFPLDGDPRDIDPRPMCWVHGWGADYPDPAGMVATALKAPSAHPAALYRDDETLAAANAFLNANDRDERLRLVEDLERTWLGEHVALVPLYYSDQVWWRSRRVHGWWTTPLMPGHITDIEIRR